MINFVHTFRSIIISLCQAGLMFIDIQYMRTSKSNEEIKYKIIEYKRLKLILKRIKIISTYAYKILSKVQLSKSILFLMIHRRLLLSSHVMHNFCACKQTSTLILLNTQLFLFPCTRARQISPYLNAF